MNRSIQFLGLIGAGLVCVIAAWWIPSHLRAVNEELIRRRGHDSPSLISSGLQRLDQGQLGVATHFLVVAETEDVLGADSLRHEIESLIAARPELARWGVAEPSMKAMRVGSSIQVDTNATLPLEPTLKSIMSRSFRTDLLHTLESTKNLGVLILLRNREVQKTHRLPPVGSASGQPMEAAIAMAAWLHHEDRFQPGLRDGLEAAAGAANGGGDTLAMESVYFDLLTMARRLDWGTMQAVIQRFEDVPQMHGFAERLGRFQSQSQQSVWVSSLLLAEQPGRVLDYLNTWGEPGLDDLSEALSYGVGGLNTLLKHQGRIYSVPTSVVWRNVPGLDGWVRGFLPMPLAGLYFKYLLTFTGGFLVLSAFTCLLPAPSTLERRVWKAKYGLSRLAVVALLFPCIGVLILEPFLFERPSPDLPLPTWQFPMATPGLISQVTEPFQTSMNIISIIALCVFLLVQGVLYAINLLKVAEIRRQFVSSELKLRLLDNEEHMFDAGLYVGLGGTVLSLVILALGVVKPGLMAAYSSTLFGILFVAILKICHVRPYRRQLILETGDRMNE